MKTTQDGSRVLIERTDRKLGCLLQGGVCGRVTSYQVADVCRVTGLEPDDMEDAELSDSAPAYDYITVGEAIQHNLGDGHVVRRGQLIQ